MRDSWDETVAATDRPVPDVYAKTIAAQTPPKDQLGCRIDAMIDKAYSAGRTGAAEKSIGKERRQSRAVLMQFVEAVRDRPLPEVTQANVADYFDPLACMLKVCGRNAVDRKRPLRDIVERAEELPDDQVGLAAGTIDRNLCHIRKLLEYARGRSLRHAGSTELSDLWEKGRRDARSVREGFDRGDLAKLAGHPVWIGCESPGRRYEPGREMIRGGLYCELLLAAYHVARN